jgi:hypothetical protein
MFHFQIVLLRSNHRQDEKARSIPLEEQPGIIIMWLHTLQRSQREVVADESGHPPFHLAHPY